MEINRYKLYIPDISELFKYYNQQKHDYFEEVEETYRWKLDSIVINHLQEVTQELYQTFTKVGHTSLLDSYQEETLLLHIAFYQHLAEEVKELLNHSCYINNKNNSRQRELLMDEILSFCRQSLLLYAQDVLALEASLRLQQRSFNKFFNTSFYSNVKAELYIANCIDRIVGDTPLLASYTMHLFAVLRSKISRMGYLNKLA